MTPRSFGGSIAQRADRSKDPTPIKTRYGRLGWAAGFQAGKEREPVRHESSTALQASSAGAARDACYRKRASSGLVIATMPPLTTCSAMRRPKDAVGLNCRQRFPRRQRGPI